MAASYWLFECPSGRAVVTTTINRESPACSTGQGSWVFVKTHTDADIIDLAKSASIQDFDVSQLTVEELTAAWGAGFTVMATGLVIVMACRALLRAIR